MTSETRVRQQWHAVESGDGGATIKSETGGYVGTIQWKGDAHEIAREHNSHDDLLAALEALMGVKNSAYRDERDDLDALRAREQAMAAIKRARGED